MYQILGYAMEGRKIPADITSIKPFCRVPSKKLSSKLI